MRPTLRELFEYLIDMGHEARRQKIAELALSDDETRRLETLLLFDDMKQCPASHQSARLATLDLSDRVTAQLQAMLALNVAPLVAQETIARAMRRLQEQVRSIGNGGLQ